MLVLLSALRNIELPVGARGSHAVLGSWAVFHRQWRFACSYFTKVLKQPANRGSFEDRGVELFKKFTNVGYYRMNFFHMTRHSTGDVSFSVFTEESHLWKLAFTEAKVAGAKLASSTSSFYYPQQRYVGNSLIASILLSRKLRFSIVQLLAVFYPWRMS